MIVFSVLELGAGLPFFEVRQQLMEFNLTLYDEY